MLCFKTSQATPAFLGGLWFLKGDFMFSGWQLLPEWCSAHILDTALWIGMFVCLLFELCLVNIHFWNVGSALSDWIHCPYSQAVVSGCWLTWLIKATLAHMSWPRICEALRNCLDCLERKSDKKENLIMLWPLTLLSETRISMKSLPFPFWK